MAVQMIVNIFIAILWMFFQDDWSFQTLFSGYLIGVIIVFAMRRFFRAPFYLKSVYASIVLVLILIRELITSAILVAKQTLQPDLNNLTPGIFALETTLEKEWEVVMLALMLTLTPGSTVILISPNRDVLYLHGLGLPESKEAVIKSAISYEKTIREVSR